MRIFLAKKAGVNERRDFFLLSVLGRDLPGAITIEPSGNNVSFGRQYSTPRKKSIAPEGALHFSLAGVQLKFSALHETTKGLTIPTAGVGGLWNVKLPSLSFAAVPENEFAMIRLAKMVGIQVPETKLIPISDISGLPEEMRKMAGNAFAIKRFDRNGDGSAIHTEDFAQVFAVYPE